MGFKHVGVEELETSHSSVFLGIPLREAESLTKGINIEIRNEETLHYEYDNKGKLKNSSGKGLISVINSSIKDQIWNSQLKLTGPQIISLDLNKIIYLENINPRNEKKIHYDIISTVNLPEPLKIVEKTEIFNIENNFNDELEQNFARSRDQKHLLVFGKENIIKFTITIENISSFLLENIRLVKIISEDFYDLKSPTEIELKNGELKWTISKLMSNNKVQLIFYLKIHPKKKKKIGTGSIKVVGKISSSTPQSLLGIKVEDFLAYSHAQHAIRIKEDEDIQNKWECNFIFRNGSEFLIKLNSILVFDEFKNKKLLDLKLKKHILPEERFVSEIWEVKSKKEPKFQRKVNYSITHEFKNLSNIQITIDQNIFKIEDILYESKFSENFFVQSARLKMEESLINNQIQIKNIGTTPISAILIKEKIPKDFLIPIGKSKFQINHSSGKSLSDNLEVKVSSDKIISSNSFILEIFLNFNEISSNKLLDLDEFLELKYPLFIVSPDYKKEYEFPIEVLSYFSKYKEIENRIDNNLYINKHIIPDDHQPSLKVGKNRRKLEINKSIYLGENEDEITINITIFNNSTKEAKNIAIIDAFPKFFEIISSRFNYKMMCGDDNENNMISFNIESILPSQEIQIKYHIRNISGNPVNFYELESFIFESGKYYSPLSIESLKKDKSSIEPKKIEIFNEENLKFYYDNHGTLNKLSGNGVFAVKNNSIIDRVWNAQLKLSGPQLVNLDLEKNVNFGVIKPEKSKKFIYDIKSATNIPNPLKISEEIDVLNVNTQEAEAIASYLNTQKIEKSLKKKKIEEKEIKDKFETHFNNIKLKLDEEQANLEE
ncbi:MAG: hypothetical protein ACFFAN_15705, partial [Promethearchaeota archaeon]